MIVVRVVFSPKGGRKVVLGGELARTRLEAADKGPGVGKGERAGDGRPDEMRKVGGVEEEGMLVQRLQALE